VVRQIIKPRQQKKRMAKSQFKDNTPKNRLLDILKALIEMPYYYKKKDFVERYDVDEKTIRIDFDELRDAGFEVKNDKHYRYGIESDKPYEHLKELLFFSQNDQDFMLQAISKMDKSDKRQERVRKKLESIYDLSRLGSNLVSKQFLTKINLLEHAKQQQKVVKLIDYYSTNSGSIETKTVEPFHISPKEDMLHAFDLISKEIRHYRISRITRVEELEAVWTYSGHHHIQATDPFRIVNDKQVRVHLRLSVGGYNELIERFPLTSPYLKPSADEKNEFELDCNVNQAFYGIANFILSSLPFVKEIVEPDALREHINEIKNKINF
jgi:predicted DNA-binding transcriptional regulator YafY